MGKRAAPANTAYFIYLRPRKYEKTGCSNESLFWAQANKNIYFNKRTNAQVRRNEKSLINYN